MKNVLCVIGLFLAFCFSSQRLTAQSKTWWVAIHKDSNGNITERYNNFKSKRSYHEVSDYFYHCDPDCDSFIWRKGRLQICGTGWYRIDNCVYSTVVYLYGRIIEIKQQNPPDERYLPPIPPPAGGDRW